MKVNLKNTSRWPTAFVALLARWIVKKAKFAPDHFDRGEQEIILRVRDTTRCRHGRAWYGRGECTLACARRVDASRLNDRYYRYEWSAVHELKSSIEMLVKILAHEIRHLTPDNHNAPTRQGCEHDAEHWAWERVLEFRAEWPALKASYMADRREAKALERNREQRAASALAEKKSPHFKLARVHEMQKAWSTKAKRAATALKKLRRKEIGLLRAIDNRAAANGGR